MYLHIQDIFTLAAVKCPIKCTECHLKFSCYTGTPIYYDYSMATKGVYDYLTMASYVVLNDVSQSQRFKVIDEGCDVSGINKEWQEEYNKGKVK